MKVIFLDIDGVLNSYKFIRSGGDVMNQLDKDCVASLNHITRAVPDAKIVVSSTWRLLHEMEWLKNFLREQGVEGEVIDKTGEYTLDKSPLYLAATRGEEIRRWLDQNPEVDVFVALDDDTDMDAVKEHHVKTSMKDGGLTMELAEEAIRRLQ